VDAEHEAFATQESLLSQGLADVEAQPTPPTISIMAHTTARTSIRFLILFPPHQLESLFNNFFLLWQYFTMQGVGI
jgi:hypothetical protein